MEWLEHIVKSLSPMGAVFTFLAIVIIAICYIQREAIGKILESRFVRKAHKSKKIKSLITHSLFTSVDKIVDKVDSLDFTTLKEYDESKTILIRLLIKMKIKTVKRRFKELVLKDGLDEMSGIDLKYTIATSLSALVNEYNDQFIDKIVEEYNVSRKDAKFMVDSYEEFRAYIVTAFSDEVESIVLDDNYDDNFERMNTILYIVSLSLNVIPKDVVQAFNKVNGRFKKYKISA